MTFPQRQLLPTDFPALLREIPDVPSSLYIRGTMPPPDHTLLCVVGSRATSTYGRRVCASLIAGLAPYPITIVSGMALGIDAEAHTAALDAGLPTIAVLPSSLDQQSLYPATNRPLAARILKEGGALISEYGEPHKAMVYDFPKRNRIVAGISHAALIIEAGEKSGTLITARLALDYNREVLAVPHELGTKTGEGVNRLIREGATLVRSADDIVQALGIKPPTQAALPVDLTASELKVLETLLEPLERDELIEESSLDIHDLTIALSSLSIRGLIIERLGKIERC
ncbi:DNA-protecting protein DprA [Candidatus Nomurabacteria bacterium]|nr:DNA-protecting protein DprA [Candidatus Nomurabacteria bacterium]